MPLAAPTRLRREPLCRAARGRRQRGADVFVSTGRDSLRCSPLRGCAPRDLIGGSMRDRSLLRVAERRWADGANPPESRPAVGRDRPLRREGSHPSL